ncbi:hypothetical protein FQA39_LY04085 [Lamprigera yunnana]|nr:hypothetical protein FQA39_LY04085 [Lamprigera yunnana]
MVTRCCGMPDKANYKRWVRYNASVHELSTPDENKLSSEHNIWVNANDNDEHTNDDEDSAKETQFVDQDQVAGTSKDTPKRGDNENKRLPKKLPGGGPQKIQKTSATEEALSIMRGIQGRHTSGLDQFETFGELVGLRIKDLPSSNAQKIVKHLISNILFEAEMGKYDHGNPLSGNYSQPSYPIPNYVQQPIPAPMPPNPNHILSSRLFMDKHKQPLHNQP